MAEQAQFQRVRARELGISIGTLSPEPLGAITDVAGVRVGQTTLVRGSGPLARGVRPVRTGVTALLPHRDNLFTSKVSAAASGAERLRQINRSGTDRRTGSIGDAYPADQHPERW